MELILISFKRFLKRIIKLIGLSIKKHNYRDKALYLKLFGEESVKNHRFYNISGGGHFGFGGGFHHPCWTNIDVDRPWIGTKKYNPKIDILHDLLTMEPIPVEDETAELVHSRYTIEHITDQAALFMFKEVYRILKKDGIFRVVTPDTDLDYRAYNDNDISFFYWIDEKREVSIEQAFIGHFAAHATVNYHDKSSPKITDEEFRNALKNMGYENALNYCVSKCSVDIQKKNRSNHINWWNYNKLNKMLQQAGFQKVYKSAPEQSVSPVMRNGAYFDNEYNKVMMFMEAKKL